MATQDIAQLVLDANTVTTIITNLNSLYSNAISQLTSYTLGVVALVGVFIPVLVTIIQSKSIKSETENLEARISNEISTVKIVIHDDMLRELKQKIQLEEDNLALRLDEKFSKFEKQLECARASSFHIQGNTHLGKEYFAIAADDFCSATEGYLRGGDELNGQRTLRLLIEDCLPKIHKTDYDELELDSKIDDLISTLKSHNDNNRYQDHIERLNKSRRAAKSREKKDTVTKQ